MFIATKHMIMKTINLSLVILLALFTQSCHDSFDTSDLQIDTSRSFQQDATVLNDFIDINKTTHQYYINPNKRTSALSYIKGPDTEQLEKINSRNLDLYQKSLDRINLLVGQSALNHFVDYIVMMTNDEVYISRINSNSAFALNKTRPNAQNDKLILTSINVADQREEFRIYTSGPILSSVELDPSIYKDTAWYFNIECEIVGNNNEEEKTSVLFCGIGYHFNPCFEWTFNQSSVYHIEHDSTWKFSIINGLNDNPRIAKINFLK